VGGTDGGFPESRGGDPGGLGQEVEGSRVAFAGFGEEIDGGGREDLAVESGAADVPVDVGGDLLAGQRLEHRTRFQFLENHGSRVLAEPFLPIANFTFFVHPTTTLSPQRVLSSLFYFCHAQSCPSQVNGNALGCKPHAVHILRRFFGIAVGGGTEKTARS